ncbi:MAG: hypothetical protein K8T26_20440 [Lentisphaerae bacterium]|nr:hypothetical protein [Lentisphaerota bacterium]
MSAPAAASPIPLSRPLSSKKDTSKIPLDAAKPRLDKVSPVATGEAPAGESPSTVRMSRPGDTAQIGGVPNPSDSSSAEKRKTSRISLDSVLSESAGGESSGPKTIRLKRPGEGPAARVGGASPEAGDGDDRSEGGAAPTQRKTVVVKRTQESASARKLSVARPSGDEAAPAGDKLTAGPISPVNEPSGVFGAVAIAASLVLCVVIYLFASQAIGPNSSMLQYSSWTGGPNLAWPGKTAWNP